MVKYDNIPGFPGYYISKRGGLWSNRKNWQWKKLKPHLNKMWNRYQCTLRDSRGIRKLCKISRLVATVYLPNPENLPIVMHLDNNPENNYYKNLKWGTQSQNIIQAYRDGNLKTPSALIARREAHSNSSITNQTRNMIVDLRINYRVPESKLSIIFGISKRHINKIVSQYKSGIRWDNNLI